MYVRTKDGVYEVEKEECGFYCCKGLEMAIAPYDEEVIKQSENLEELCDEFVKVDNSDNKPYRPFIIYGRSLGELNERQKCNESLYGAIWVKGKGLIYVAKMNENGELELI